MMSTACVISVLINNRKYKYPFMFPVIYSASQAWIHCQGNKEKYLSSISSQLPKAFRKLCYDINFWHILDFNWITLPRNHFAICHRGIMAWRRIPHHGPFVRGNNRSLVSPTNCELFEVSMLYFFVDPNKHFKTVVSLVVLLWLSIRNGFIWLFNPYSRFLGIGTTVQLLYRC